LAKGDFGFSEEVVGLSVDRLRDKKFISGSYSDGYSLSEEFVFDDLSSCAQYEEIVFDSLAYDSKLDAVFSEEEAKSSFVDKLGDLELVDSQQAFLLTYDLVE
jgi:hypothetical protein